MAWHRLRGQTRAAISSAIVFAVAFYTITVAYIEYVSALTHSEAFLFDFVPFITSLLLLGGIPTVVAVYMLLDAGGSRNTVLGSLWMLTVLPVAISLYSDFTALDYPWLLLLIITAVQYWRGRAGGWVRVVGAVILIWFVIDPVGHTYTWATVVASASTVYVTTPLRALMDWFRLAFFSPVFFFSVRRARAKT